MTSKDLEYWAIQDLTDEESEAFNKALHEMRYGPEPATWDDSRNHPDIPEQHYDEETCETEDYCEYVARVETYLSEHPPAAPPGFYLVPCGNEPRHWPQYVPVFNDVYEPVCSQCSYAALSESHDGCEHSHHHAWSRWRITKTAMKLLYPRFVKGWRTSYSVHCKGCVSGISWKRPNEWCGNDE